MRSEEEQLTRFSECQQKSVVVITLFLLHHQSPVNRHACIQVPPLTSFFVAFCIDTLQPLTLLIRGNSFPSLLYLFSSGFRRFSSVCHVIFKVLCFSLFQATPLSFSGSVLAFSLSLSSLFSFLAFHCSGSVEDDPGLRR